MFEPLRITAHLSVGIAHSSPWSCSLDGLLASQLWARQKHATPPSTPPLAQDYPPDLDLPLARCTLDPTWWHWAATCGWPGPLPDRPEIRWWHSRLDHRHAEHTIATVPRQISDASGSWKAYRMPLPITLTGTLTWHALGDPEAIAALLTPIQSIGKKRGQGEGRVTRWSIETADLSTFAAGHLAPDGTLARPTPHACLAGLAITDGGDGYAAIRPPHMHPSRKTDVRLPAPYT